ncbi:MAG: hypothetical protein ACYCYP_00380 [Leptospirales bacterium]
MVLFFLISFDSSKAEAQQNAIEFGGASSASATSPATPGKKKLSVIKGKESKKLLKKPLPQSPAKAGQGENGLKTASLPPPLSRNGPDSLAAYRKMWNPITGGPNFTPLADTLPEGELNGRMFFYSRFTQAQYTDSGGITGLPNGFYQTQLLLLGAIYYGWDSNTELVLLPSMITTFSETDGQSLNGTGLNDLTMGIKHRWVIQNPSSWRPSISSAFLVTLPTSAWLGTPVQKGGLPPLSVVPSTHFGSPALTTGLFVRKNVQPFRLMGDLFYTFNFPTTGVLPGNSSSRQIQYGDLAQYRLALEDVFNDKTGFGGILELVGLSGLPFSIDGIRTSVQPTNFNLVGLQPAVEYNLTERLMFSAGVLLPVFGNNEYMAMTPNFSIWYYWGAVDGKLLPR